MPGKTALALPLALLLLLGGLTSWIERTVRVTAAPGAAARQEPESIVENFRALKTGPDGRMRYRLEARTLRHYDGDRPSELTEPRFSQLAADGGTIRASARRAVLAADGNTVTLSGTVRMERMYGSQPGLVLDTEHLIVHPDGERLSAPGPVALEDRLWQARAGRMELDNSRRVVKLSGRVRAVYRHAPS